MSLGWSLIYQYTDRLNSRMKILIEKKNRLLLLTGCSEPEVVIDHECHELLHR